MKIQRNPGFRHIICPELGNAPVALVSHLPQEVKTLAKVTCIGVQKGMQKL